MFDELEKTLEGALPVGEFKSTRDWGGADVIITGKPSSEETEWLKSQPTVISFQQSQAKRRLIVTKYHQELSWLFNKLRDIAGTRIDYVSKYDFYSSLAVAAMNHIAEVPDDDSPRTLLSNVAKAAKDFLLQ